MGYERAATQRVAALLLYSPPLHPRPITRKSQPKARIFKNQKPKFMKPFTCSQETWPQVFMIRTAAKVLISV
jgi:hypothetical protein